MGACCPELKGIWFSCSHCTLSYFAFIDTPTFPHHKSFFKFSLFNAQHENFMTTKQVDGNPSIDDIVYICFTMNYKWLDLESHSHLAKTWKINHSVDIANSVRSKSTKVVSSLIFIHSCLYSHYCVSPLSPFSKNFQSLSALLSAVFSSSGREETSSLGISLKIAC